MVQPGCFFTGGADMESVNRKSAHCHLFQNGLLPNNVCSCHCSETSSQCNLEFYAKDTYEHLVLPLHQLLSG